MLILTYRDHRAEVDFDWLDLCWVGRATETDNAVDFRGATVEEAEQDFHHALDVYLAGSEEVEPEAVD